MHLPECHFKVAELKMHLRRLVPGVVSRGVGLGGCVGKEDGGGRRGGRGWERWRRRGGRLVSSRWGLIRGDLNVLQQSAALGERPERTVAGGGRKSVGVSLCWWRSTVKGARWSQLYPNIFSESTLDGLLSF